MVEVLKAFGSENKKTLLVSSDEKVIQASNNLKNVKLTFNKNISVYDLLNSDKVFMLVDDVKTLEGGLK